MKHPIQMVLTISLVCLAAGAAGAQQPLPTFPALPQIQSSGMVGITTGQTARLNALNPGVPAPLATGARCPAHVAFMDDQGNLLKGADITVDPGKSVAIDLNRDTDAPMTAPRLQIRAVITFAPPTPVTPVSGGSYTGFLSVAAACRLTPTLEIIDNDTSKTRFLLTDFAFTYPVAIGAVLTPAR